MSDTDDAVTLRVAAVAKVYASSRGPVEALREVTFDVRKGEFVSIVGPSGCGKSTLLKMIAGVSSVSRGQIALDGKTIDGPSPGFGMVFQSPLLLEWRTVLANVLLPAEAMGRRRDDYVGRAKELIATVGLGSFQDHYPHELSGGMRQRAAICRALLCDPSLLLMDEPFGALDALTRDDMATSLSRIHQDTGKTVLFVTHSIEEAVFLSDRVIVMTGRPGSIAASFTIDLPRPRQEATRFDGRFSVLHRQIREIINAGKTV